MNTSPEYREKCLTIPESTYGVLMAAQARIDKQVPKLPKNPQPYVPPHETLEQKAMKALADGEKTTTEIRDILGVNGGNVSSTMSRALTRGAVNRRTEVRNGHSIVLWSAA